ncbi:malonate decarboxylase holo-ACP synthase [Telmatospirillum siberiense]|uniref:Phosphoribosyl-dephospho-CoA transferase n=1 Tax=Telmatospirillum siberiense TaxID=382514 RepID=A0A2N3PZE7_9PROT|nr:malonate decarboxylase holo-ACP synthase [Telmatospirillum siberiense]PKU25731.1 hypothetical protein CWS72_03965 [Telmatospirillum siberiense]
MGGALIRPHDLVEPERIDAIVGDGPLPAWVPESLAAAPLVVVRRVPISGGRLPIGVRGVGRERRFAGWLDEKCVRRVVRPQDLTARAAWRTAPRAAELPHFTILAAIDVLMVEAGLPWGPTGSAGFELASGKPTMTAASDIDLLICPHAPPTPQNIARLHDALGAFPVRIDGQMALTSGWVALAEFARAPRRIALRTLTGVELIENPWKDQRR